MTTGGSLRAWLGTLDDDALAAVLTVRGEVLRGAPVRDLDDLAERLVHPASVAEVLVEQPLPLVQVLAALAACGAGASTSRVAGLLQPSAAGAPSVEHEDLVRGCVDSLVRSALVWPSPQPDGPLVVNPGVLVVAPDPLGAGRPAQEILRDIPADALKRVLKGWGQAVPTRKIDLAAAVETALADPAHVRAVVADAPAEVTAYLLERVEKLADRFRSPRPLQPAGDGSVEFGDDEDEDDLMTAGFDPQAYRAAQSALAWARAHGLAFSRYGGLTMYGPVEVELPSEVALALVGPDVRLPFDPLPPSVPAAPVVASQVHGAASAAATETVALTMAVLETIDRQPVTALKNGGIGAREIARLARLLGAAPADVRLVLELAGALRLLEPSPSGNRIGTSGRFAQWRRAEPGSRAADLVAAWLDADVVPSVDRDLDGRTAPALGRRERRSLAPLLRTAVLEQAGGLEDRGITDADALADLILWHLPYVGGPQVREEIRLTWQEAARLGVVALGALSEAGRAALDEGTASLVTELDRMLPATQTTALFGSDLTVVVPGSPAPGVVDLLDAVAVREARGSAGTWRLTPESVRRALDDGHGADDLLGRLGALAQGNLPQALDYLVRDVARRHGHVGVQGAGAVVLGEDAALLAEIAAHRSLRSLALRQVAPTVLVAADPPDTVLHALRGAGYLPVPLDRDGVRAISVARPAERTGAGDDVGPGGEAGRGGTDDGGGEDEDADVVLRRWVAEMAGQRDDDAGVPVPGHEHPADAAGRLRRGEAPPQDGTSPRLEAEIRRHTRRLSEAEVRHLAYAIQHRVPVQLRYRSASGGVTVRLVSDLALRGGYLYGWCHLRQDERFFSLDGVLSVVTG